MRLAAGIAALALGWGHSAWAQEQSAEFSVSYEAQAGVATTYVFRGVPQYSTPRIPSSMNEVEATFAGLGPGEAYADLFTAFALKDRTEQANGENEIDLELGYSLEVSKQFEVGGAYRVFFLPTDDPVDSSHEFGANAAMLELPVKPGVEVWVDPIREKGVYAKAFVNKEFATGPATLTPQLSAGVQKYKGVAGGFNDVTAQLSARWRFPYNIFVAGLAAYAYAHVLSGDYVDRSVYWYYLGVGYER